MKTYRVKIGLYVCSKNGARILILEDREGGGGKRLSGHKPVVANFIEALVCDVTVADLRRAELRPKVAFSKLLKKWDAEDHLGKQGHHA